MNRIYLYILLSMFSYMVHAETQKQYAPVAIGRSFSFPKDHKPHLGFKTEWWYYTGFLDSENNTSIGIQYTLFKIELEPGNVDFKDSPILMVTHLGIANLTTKSFESYTDHVRLYPGLAQFNILNNGFDFSSKGNELFTRYSIKDKSHSIFIRNQGKTIFDSIVTEKKPVVLQGEDGYSLKDFSGLASYYYSIPELEGEANITSNGEIHRGKISLWLDREFSSKFMQKEKSGWDWIHFTMENGDKYLAFQIRNGAEAKTFHYGILIRNNKKIAYPVVFTPKKYSRLSSQNTYPTQWEVQIGEDNFLISAMIYDSEMKGILPYWEGPIQVKNLQTSETGRGYLEMTGYGKKLPDWL